MSNGIIDKNMRTSRRVSRKASLQAEVGVSSVVRRLDFSAEDKSNELFPPSPEKPKIKKIKKRKDGAWNRHVERGAVTHTQGGGCAWRFNQAKVATAVLFDGAALGIDPRTPNRALLSTLQEKLHLEKTYSPIAAIKKYSATGSPEVVVTDKGKELSYQGTNGIARFFQEGLPHRSRSFPVLDSSFEQSEIFKKIKPHADQVVEVSTDVTAKEMKSVKKEKQANGGRRHVQQANIMGGSAKEYLAAAGMGTEGEWAHGVPHQFKGKQSQRKKNLTGASSFTNSRSLAEVETPVADIVKIYSTAQFRVRTHCQHQLLRKVEYVCETKDFKLQFAIPGEVVTPNKKPHKSRGHYVRSISAAIMAAHGQDVGSILSGKKGKKEKAEKAEKAEIDKKIMPDELLFFYRENKETLPPKLPSPPLSPMHKKIKRQHSPLKSSSVTNTQPARSTARDASTERIASPKKPKSPHTPNHVVAGLAASGSSASGAITQPARSTASDASTERIASPTKPKSPHTPNHVVAGLAASGSSASAAGGSIVSHLTTRTSFASSDKSIALASSAAAANLPAAVAVTSQPRFSAARVSLFGGARECDAVSQGIDNLLQSRAARLPSFKK